MPSVTRLSDFVPAIREEGEDNASRLIAADWLEDQGDDSSLKRAKLIRLQCDEINNETFERVRKLLPSIPLSQFGLPRKKGTCAIRKAIISRGFVKNIAGHTTPLLQAARSGVHTLNPLNSIRIRCSTSRNTLHKLLSRGDILQQIQRVQLFPQDIMFFANDTQGVPKMDVLQTDYHHERLYNDELQTYAPLFHLSSPPRVLELAMQEITKQEVLSSALPELTRNANTQVVVVIDGQRSTSQTSFEVSKMASRNMRYLSDTQICELWNSFLVPCEEKIHDHLIYRIEPTDRSVMNIYW